MDPRIINITVPLGQLLRPVALSGALMQGEVHAHRFVVTASEELSGTVTAKFMRGDRKTITLAGEIEDGAAVVTLAQGCYDVSGDFLLSIFLTSGNMTACLCVITGRVERTAGSYTSYPSVSAAPGRAVLVEDAMPWDAEALSVGITPTTAWTGPSWYAEDHVEAEESQPVHSVSLNGQYTLYAEAYVREAGTSGKLSVIASNFGSVATVELSLDGIGTYAGCATFNGQIKRVSMTTESADPFAWGASKWPVIVRAAILPGSMTLNDIYAYRAEHPMVITGHTGAQISHSGEDTSEPEEISVSWQTAAGTVYFGTLDVLTGVLTATHAALTVDGQTVAFTEHTYSEKQQYRVVNDFFKSVVNNSRCLSSWSVPGLLRVNKSSGFAYGYADAESGSADNWAARLGVTSLEQLNALCAETPLVIIGQLDTPATYQLAAHPLVLLSGANTIWADCGDVALTYKADPLAHISGQGGDQE